MSDAATAATRSPRVTLLGNPNTGKSTLFNVLTGGLARVGNYTGTTVERLEGSMTLGEQVLTVVDVPGIWSLAARSPDERVALDCLLGLDGSGPPEVVVVVGDAVRLHRSLYLLLQVLDLGVPVVFGLNLIDEARSTGQVPDAPALAAELGVPVVPLVARTGEGLEELRQALAEALVSAQPAGAAMSFSDALEADLAFLAEGFPAPWSGLSGGGRRGLAAWMLLSSDEPSALDGLDLPVQRCEEIRARASAAGRDLPGELVGERYAWIDEREGLFRTGGPVQSAGTVSERLDRWLLHPVTGTAIFLAVMTLVFWSLFAWSDPAIGAVESVFGAIGGIAEEGFAALSAGAGGASGVVDIFGDLVVNGIIGGVGAVLVFLPQIALLFLMLAVLEDCGYLSRAAHLTDRVLRAAGLPGQAFVPLISGFACAVPAVLATRTLPRARDRLLTMLVVPLTSCSARLPVYVLLIGALFPVTWDGLGGLPVRPLALLGMYLLSTLVTVGAAVVLGRTLLEDRATAHVLELPPYRWPHIPTVLRLVVARSGDFVREAGRVILVATIVLWAMLSFPRYSPEELLAPDVIAEAVAQGESLESLAAPLALERSYAGRFGKLIEPVIAPLGYDWKIGIGLIGSFAAREVFVSTMGVVYGIEEATEESTDLRSAMASARDASGNPVWTPLTGASLMVFFAFAMQCLSTLAVLRRESGSWKWPLFAVAYLTGLAWVSALLVYQVGRALGYS